MTSGQRPSAALLHDPYAGHRDYEDWLWVPDPHRDTQWTDWDYALAEAVTALDSMMSPSGHPRWLAEDPGVYWDVAGWVDYGVQTLQKAMEEWDGGVPPEVNLYLKNPTKNGELWTLDQWLEYREAHEDDMKIDRDAPDGAHAPEADEFLEMQRQRQARIDAKYAELDADDEPVN